MFKSSLHENVIVKTSVREAYKICFSF